MSGLRGGRKLQRAALAALALVLGGCASIPPGGCPVSAKAMDQGTIDANNAIVLARGCRDTSEGCDVPVQLISGNAPVYPCEELLEGRTGTVVLRFLVDESGLPSDFKVDSTPSEGFTRAAIDAVRTWKFKPSRLRGDPIRHWVVQPVSFQL